jgi:transcriptional regulator with XRE-family HTH domain
MRRARAIRELRERSLDETSEATGIDKGSLSKFERGKVGLSQANLLTLATYLETSIDELLREEQSGNGRKRQKAGASGR